MFQYAFGQALIAKNNEVLYDVTWFNKSHKKKVAGRQYGLDLFGATPKFASSELSEIYAGKNMLYNLTHPQIPQVKDEGWGAFQPEILQLSGHAYYNGYFQTEKYFKEIEQQIRKEFTFPSLPEDDAFNQEWLNKIKSAENSVCIHIRRGDYLNLSGWVLPLSYYRDAAAYIIANVKNPTFFVFGSECDDFIKKEFDIGCKFEIIGETNAQNKEDWKDMVLMSACKHAVIANSTFSWWAAWLGENKSDSGIIIAPSPFVENDEIIPSRWTKIKR
jgi:hypothetical protein